MFAWPISLLHSFLWVALGKSPCNQREALKIIPLIIPFVFVSLHLNLRTSLEIVRVWETRVYRFWSLSFISSAWFIFLSSSPPLHINGIHEEEIKSPDRWEVWVDRRERRAVMLLGLDGWRCFWTDCLIALGAFLFKDKVKQNSSQKHLFFPLLLPPWITTHMACWCWDQGLSE